jgi:hypothetical protein
MMRINNMRLPILMIVIGMIIAVASCFLTCILQEPVIREHDFEYTVTYQLDGEVKTFEGVFKCGFNGYSTSGDLTAREYVGQYTQNGVDSLSHIYTIAQKDGAELSIVAYLDAAYLMGDPEKYDNESGNEDPYLSAEDAEGFEMDVSEVFDAEIISWEYPKPVENSFTFVGFSLLHTGSMLVMLVIGLLTMIACLIFVKRDKTTPRKVLDTLSVVLNFGICLMAIPFITVATGLLQLTMSSDALLYQIFLCTPALTAFTVAASIALRRNGFTKTGFFVQFAGPVLFFVPVVLASLIGNVFG